MISDFTLGQYYPSKSVVHKIDPRVKIIFLIVTIVLIYCTSNIFSLGFISLTVLTILLVTKVPFSTYFKNLKIILPILVFTFFVNLFYMGDGNVLIEFLIFKITDEGIYRSVFMAVRLVMLILISSSLTYTTTPNELTDALESLLAPLKYIGLGNAVHVMFLMMTIALRFIPTLAEETEKIINAQKARGADFESGRLTERVKAIIPIIIPLLISSVRRAYDLAEAMESRCYNGGKGKTRMNVLRLRRLDYFIFGIMLLITGGVILINYL